MPVDSSTAYIPLDGSSHGGCWGQRSTLERGLIFIVACLALVVLTLTIAIAYKKCEEPPVTTVAPSSTTPHNVTTVPPKTTPHHVTTNAPPPKPTVPPKTTPHKVTTKSPTPKPTNPPKTTPHKVTTKSPPPKPTVPPKTTPHKPSTASPHSSDTKKSGPTIDLTHMEPTATKNETSINLEANEVSAKNVSGADLVSTTADNKTVS